MEQHQYHYSPEQYQRDKSDEKITHLQPQIRLVDVTSDSLSSSSQNVIFAADRWRKKENAYTPLADTATIAETIIHFDTFYKEEGLPVDWYTMSKKVGFSMDSQMKLLEGTDRFSKSQWVERTKQDVLGFGLEYLSKGLVYPFQYSIQTDSSGRPLLMDKKYGKGMVETTTEKERNGSVKESLQRIEAFLGDANTREGAIAIMPSPAGPSGLTTDDGRAITYPDSYWFVMQKKDGEVHGFTIKTDFTLYETRRAIQQLTGKKIPLNAPVEEYVRALSLTEEPKEGMASIEEVVSVLQKVKGSEKAFKNQRWSEVYRDIAKGPELYTMTDQIQSLIDDFEIYVMENDVTPEEMQKALAALLYRMSRIMLFDQSEEYTGGRGTTTDLFYQRVIPPTYGEVLTEVARIPGCAGGGDSGVSSMTILGVSRVTVASGPAIATESCPKIACKECSWVADESEVAKIQRGDLTKCPKCGWKP